MSQPTDVPTAPGTMIAVTVYFTSDDFLTGWGNDPEELRLSVAAACHEVIGDDGVPYQPAGTTVATPQPEPSPRLTALLADEADDEPAAE